MHNNKSCSIVQEKERGAHIFGVFMKQLITQETLNPKTKFKGIINHRGWIPNTHVSMSRKTNWKT
jgi:hypothetical protein